MQPQTAQPAIDRQPNDTPSVPSASPDSQTDLDNLRAENEQLRTQLRLRTAREQILAALATERARSPELLFQASSQSLEFDDAGNLANADALLTELKQKFPEQFLPETPPPPLPPAPPPSINSGAGRTNTRLPLTKEILATMKPRSIANLDWNDVKQIMES